MDKYTFGNKLYKLRTESDLTQKDLANILGVSDKAVSKWETGEAMPRVKTLKNIADCFSVTYEDLLSQTEELKTNETEKYEAYETFYQKKVAKIKKDISCHLLVVLVATILNFVIKAVVFLEAEFAGVSTSIGYLFFCDFLPLLPITLFIVWLKKLLRTGRAISYKQFEYSWDIMLVSIASQFFTTMSNLNATRVPMFLCDCLIVFVIGVSGIFEWLKYKKGKNIVLPKRGIVLCTGILVILLLVAYGVVVDSISVSVVTNIFKVMLVKFLPVYIMYEVYEYQSLLEMKKETEKKNESKPKRNLKKILVICLVSILTFSVLVLFVPGLIFKTLAQNSPSAKQGALFYDEIAISFSEENLKEYSLEGIKISLPEEYELLEKVENEHYTMLKFSKSGVEDFLLTIIQKQNFETEPLDITGSLFLDEEGKAFAGMLENTFGFVPSTNEEYYRLLYSIDPDDANIFDIEECITYFVMIKSRDIYTWNGNDEMEFFDNGVFQAEVVKSKGVTLSEKEKLEIDKSGKFERYNAYITFYADEQGADDYQIYYKPESGDTADHELLHKLLNTVEKAE